MADIQVRIKLNAGVDGDQIDSVAFNQETNNVSKAVGSNTTKNDGQNLISWGNVVKDSEGNIVSKVVNGEVVTTGLLSLADGYVGGSNATLSSQGGYNGFVFGVVPENKMYLVEVTLEGSDIDSVTFYGDKNANQFPTRAIVNGEYIYSDDAEWTIVFPSVSNTQTITFDMWNRANYNACFTHIGIFVNELVLDKSSIRSVESLSQSTGQPKDIYYGLTPSSGRVEIIDINGEIKDYIEDGILDPDNVPISIYANGKKINEQIINNSSYSLNGVLLGNMTSKFHQWENVKHPTIKLKDSTNLYEILKEVMLSSGVCTTQDDLDKMLKRKVLDGNYNNLEMSIKNHLINIKIPYPYVESNYIRQTIDEICTIAQLNVYQNDDGEMEFISSRPIVLSNEKPIRINTKNIFRIEEDIIIRNKYDGISCIQYVPHYEYQNDSSAHLEFFILPPPTIIDGNLYYPYNYSNFENGYSYNAKDYENFRLVHDKALYMDSTNGYFSIYKYVPSNNHISAIYASNLQINYSVSQSRSIIKYGDVYYLSPFQNYENTTYSSGGNFSKSEFEQGIKIENGETVIQPYIIRENDGLPSLFYNGKVETYTVFDEEGNLEYYVILPTHHLYYNTPASSTDGIVSKMYSMNMMIKSLTFENKKIEFGKNPLQLQSNTLMQTESIITQINNNIRYDYSKGIKTANATISCSDYYYIDGRKAKDWDNGEILQVGDIISIGDYNTLWRVTGRNFRKNGVPMVDLELQEVNKIQS